MTNEQLNELVEKHAGILKEFFDSVQVLTTWVDENGCTRGKKFGMGDWYARQGIAREFVEQNQAELQASEIGKQINPPDDGDTWKAS